MLATDLVLRDGTLRVVSYLPYFSISSIFTCIWQYVLSLCSLHLHELISSLHILLARVFRVFIACFLPLVHRCIPPGPLHLSRKLSRSGVCHIVWTIYSHEERHWADWTDLQASLPLY
jgi:hypothetical protein